MAGLNKPLFQTLKDALSLAGSKGRNGFVKSFLLSTINSFLEIFTLATAIPLILYSIARPENPEGRFAALFEQILNHSLFSNSIINVLLLLALLLLIKNIFGTYISYFQIRLSYGVASNLSEQLLKSYYQQPYLEYTRGNSGEHHNEVNNVPTVFAYNIFLAYIYIFSELAVACILCIGLILVSPYIFLITTSFFVVVTLLALWAKNRYARKISMAKRSLFSSTSKSLMKALDAFIMVRLFQKEEFFVEAYSKKLRSLHAESIKDRVLHNVPRRVLELAGFLGVIIIIYLFSSTGKSTTEMVTILGLFATAAYRIIPSLNKLISQSVNIKSHLYLMDILKTRFNAHTHQEKSTHHEVESIQSLEVERISMAYADKKVLEETSLTITSGQVYGIAGASGSGKSTLLHILTGLLKPGSGQLLLNGKPFEAYYNIGWFRQICLVGQNPLIIDDTIARNIALGGNATTIDNQKVREALDLVGLSKFSSNGPNGLRKEVGENGLQLSGGEKRRIALARAIYRDPEVYFFDEITNDLDEASARLIYELLSKLSGQGKMVVWVTHDPKGLDFCDEVYDLANQNKRER